MQTLRNKFLRICCMFWKIGEFITTQEYFLFRDWIKTQFKNFHTNLKTSGRAHFYNLEIKTKNRRLKLRLPQDLLLSNSSENIDQIKKYLL